MREVKLRWSTFKKDETYAKKPGQYMTRTKKSGAIYAIFNIRTRELLYIGSSLNLPARTKHHLSKYDPEDLGHIRFKWCNPYLESHVRYFPEVDEKSLLEGIERRLIWHFNPREPDQGVWKWKDVQLKIISIDPDGYLDGECVLGRKI